MFFKKERKIVDKYFESLIKAIPDEMWKSCVNFVSILYKLRLSSLNMFHPSLVTEFCKRNMGLK